MVYHPYRKATSDVAGCPGEDDRGNVAVCEICGDDRPCKGERAYGNVAEGLIIQLKAETPEKKVNAGTHPGNTPDWHAFFQVQRPAFAMQGDGRR